MEQPVQPSLEKKVADTPQSIIKKTKSMHVSKTKSSSYFDSEIY